MKLMRLFAAMCCIAGLIGCGEGKHTDLFDYSRPVDLSDMLQTYDWYQHYEGEDKDSIMYAK